MPKLVGDLVMEKAKRLIKEKEKQTSPVELGYLYPASTQLPREIVEC